MASFMANFYVIFILNSTGVGDIAIGMSLRAFLEKITEMGISTPNVSNTPYHGVRFHNP